MTEVERRILLNLELLGIRDADLLVAFSGGVDSVVFARCSFKERVEF